MRQQILNKKVPIPLYYQLKEIIRNLIESGQLKPHDQIPPEDELCRRYGVSKTTVRQALNELAILGLVRRVQGKGTFVAEPRIEQGPQELTSFSQEMSRRGLRPSSRLLVLELVEPVAKVERELQLEAGQLVVCVKRLRLADDEPMGLQTAYLPAELVPGLWEAEERIGTGSLYEHLERHYGLIPSYARETHYAVTLDELEAELLQVEPGSVGLAGERTTFLESGRPLEYVHSVMRGDRFKVVLNLVRKTS